MTELEERAEGGLLALVRALIAQDGPISVERYMALTLGHPRYGYYQTRDPFGAAGDFTTAPEISQMFGELIGLWAASVWQQMGCPDPIRLVELGPGRGTLMSDALRASRAMPAFASAIDVHLVETSPVLREIQGRTLAAHTAKPTWHASVDTLPPGPAIVLGNEFFDALPIRQFVRTAGGWRERLIGLDARGALVFGLAPESLRDASGEAPEGAVLEVNIVAAELVDGVGRRLATHGGACLIIDYGYSDVGSGDTLQAVKAHGFVDPLAEPGDADLTAHVDFARLAAVASKAGLAVSGPIGQGAFLRALGLDHRAAILIRRATPAQRPSIEAAVARLAGPDPGMGDLFKVLAITPAAQPQPPGFA